MGKRNILVLSSSENEDEVHHYHTRSSGSSSKSRSKSRRSSPPPTTRHSKKGSTTSGGAGGSKRTRRSLLSSDPPLPTVDFDSFCEGFYQGFEVSKQLPGSLCSGYKRELWVDKYAPQSLEELAVHKRKLEEVKTWLEQRLRTSKEEIHNNALVITGQTGVGKSASVRVIASSLGLEVSEWRTPTPTLWQEYVHSSNLGISYMSKLDEFENFVEKIRKYSLLPTSSIGGLRKRYLLLIDDLPLANGKAAHGRLCRCLYDLVRSTQIPTVILMTEYNKVDNDDNTARRWEDLQSSVESAGACKVSFNPVTTKSMKMTLSRICKEEQYNVASQQIDLITKASGGDIRNAITSLQYFCLRPGKIRAFTPCAPTATQSKEQLDDVNGMDGVFALPFGRDETLSLFHVLGKFLHNKREILCASNLGNGEFPLRERFKRLPLKMDDPEKVLSQTHGQARQIADFLHENVLDFISDEAVDDAWAVTTYLSDADLLASSHGFTWSQTITGQHELDKIPQLAAASVSVRGVLFGNSHPSPSRWHAIRKPKIWQVEQSSRLNKNKLLKQRVEYYGNASPRSMASMATEYKPVLMWLGCRESEIRRVEGKVMMEEDKLEQMSVDGVEGEEEPWESEGDEIEDW